ncbi:aminodeoxychorismate lyase apoprotein [Thiogranum longum]|uniref:Aminodeoxychorismate lyase n=1 Tax=Thiogranum longum TaxID=1537524 RepID=A0A4R1HCF7_9GAMM|nr:aminodeoxychorismate lyase [Thiogranum longum]TCK18311.1 aminodeoxychorismate lyase apoprotein [Thiogranum longum]
MRCLVDGEPTSSIPVSDRGLQYGDGLFETFAVRDGGIQFPERHFTRLAAGCERLGFPAVDWSALRSEVIAFTADKPAGVLKLMLTRGSGQRGYAADKPAVRRILCLSDLPEWRGVPGEQGIRVRLCRMQLAIQPHLAGLKHLNRLEQVLARREWQDDDIREGLLCDTGGHIIEGTMSNLFVVSNGVLYTPQLDNCGVAGVMRSVIIDVAAQASRPLEICALSRQDVQQASELFVCNSLIGIWPVTAIDGLGEYPVGPVTCNLQTLVQNHTDHNNNTWYAK